MRLALVSLISLLTSIASSSEFFRASDVAVVTEPRTRGLRLVPGIRAGDSVTTEDLAGAELSLKRQLAEQGFVWAAVTSDTSVGRAGAAIRFEVTRGPAARVGGWTIEDNASISESYSELRLPGRRARFGARAVQQATTAVEQDLAEQGFPFADVRCSSVGESMPFVFPVVSVDRGPRVWLGALAFGGNPGTRPALLERVARFRPGWYAQGSVAAWQRNLAGSGLVLVDSAAVVSQDTGYGLQFWVSAQKSGRAAAAAGYDPDARRLAGYASLRLENLFDTRRRLAVDWHSAYGRNRYAMSYTEPWVLGTGADVTLAAEHETEDTLTARTSLSLGGVVTARSRVMVTLETGLDMVTDAATDLKARTVWAGTGVAHDTRDFPANPRSGMRAWLSTRAGTRQADSGSAGLVSRVRAGLTGLEPLGRVLALFGNAAAQAVFSVADLGRAELPGLGGAGSVRGFREHEFRSGRAVWLNIETRLVPDRGTRVYPFFDCGAFEEQGRWRVISGYGAGARAATRVGVLGVDYGVAAGESLLRGKVHISYEGSFQ